MKRTNISKHARGWLARVVVMVLTAWLLRCAPNGSGCSSSLIPSGECFEGYTCDVILPKCAGSGCDGLCSVPCTSNADCAPDCQCGLSPADRDAGYSHPGYVWRGKPCLRLVKPGALAQTPTIQFNDCRKR